MASSVKTSSTPSVCHQRDVLLDQARFRLGQDAAEILAGQRAQFDADRQAALQFGQQVGRLGDVERARCDEQDMVGLDGAVLGRNRRAFDQRQQIALHAFAADIAADAAAFSAGAADLVDLVEKHDAVVLDRFDGFLHDLIVIEQLVAFLGDQQAVSCRRR